MTDGNQIYGNYFVMYKNTESLQYTHESSKILYTNNTSIKFFKKTRDTLFAINKQTNKQNKMERGGWKFPLQIKWIRLYLG